MTVTTNYNAYLARTSKRRPTRHAESDINDDLVRMGLGWIIRTYARLASKVIVPAVEGALSDTVWLDQDNDGPHGRLCSGYIWGREELMNREHKFRSICSSERNALHESALAGGGA